MLVHFFFSLDNAQRFAYRLCSKGEKSFAQMCLILALGEKLETPFRALDEFDVFLDTPTRNKTLQLLTRVALQAMSHRQFIFISPQNIPDLGNDIDNAKVKILRMSPPERRGAASGSSQQTLRFPHA